MNTTMDESELLPCPFCWKPLRVSPNKINPSARCVTDDCIGGRMPVVNLDDARMVAAWNTRAIPTPDHAYPVNAHRS